MPADYYDLLSVPRDADERTLKKAYRAAAMECHPDRNPGDAAAEARFKDISEAYEVLSDPQKRQIYDRYGHEGLKSQGFGGFHGANVEDIFSHFSDLFGDFFGLGGGGGRRQARRGSDLLIEIEISLKECLDGVQRELEIPREHRCETCNGSGAAAGTQPQTCQGCGGTGQVQVVKGIFHMSSPCPRCRGQGRTIKDPCKPCHGRGRVRVTKTVKVGIPAGIESGMRLRVTGQGEEGPAGTPNGDLYVAVGVTPDPRFERQGPDLGAEVHVPMVKACLGGTFTFEALDGAVEVTLEPGTQPGTVLRVRGRGLPRIDNRSGRGDLHLRVAVDIPRRLTPAQIDLLKALDSADSPAAT